MRPWTKAALACLALAPLTAPGCADRTPKTGELTALADKYGTDKGNLGHHYTPVYELFFAPIKYEAKKVFEIGVFKGASMRVWHDYFPNAVVYGIEAMIILKDICGAGDKETKAVVHWMMDALVEAALRAEAARSRGSVRRTRAR